MINKDFEPIDPAVSPRFSDIATFMRTRRHDISPQVDVGLVGVPFDLGVNHRTGARHGPSGVRDGSRVIRRVHPSRGIAPFEICNVADLGDAPINPMSKDISIAQIQKFFEQLVENEIAPIACGGDHTIPLPILRAIAKNNPVGVLHFDAHADTLDELVGDGPSYISLDIDGLDPAFLPGTGVPEIGGITPRDAQVIIRSLQGR